jgi:hypothetical protein
MHRLPAKGINHPVRLVAAIVALAASLSSPPSAQAAGQHHGLLMWIGQYGQVDRNLPGIALDAERARRMAAAMGIPDGLRRELSEAQLTLRGMADALDALERRVTPGDRVFIYFSGHGKQIDGSRFGARCSEGVVTQEGALYLDVAIEHTLQRLAAKADVVMMNDSCHSGGAATKRFSTDAQAEADDEVPKAYPGPVSTLGGHKGSGEDAAACGDAVNKGANLAEFLPRAIQGAGRWLYIAASRADEAAFATRRGSRATQAWQACLAAPDTDVDRDGQVTGEELRACAQRHVDAAGQGRQTITLMGDATLPLLSRGRR